jgi:hypothetical protein
MVAVVLAWLAHAATSKQHTSAAPALHLALGRRHGWLITCSC